MTQGRPRLLSRSFPCGVPYQNVPSVLAQRSVVVVIGAVRHESGGRRFRSETTLIFAGNAPSFIGAIPPFAVRSP